MTPLEIIKDAYDRSGICYAQKSRESNLGRYDYLSRCAEHKKAEIENLGFEDFIAQSNEFIEFLNGEIASY